LKLQLSEAGGAGVGGEEGGKTIVKVQKIIKVHDQEKAKQMEDNIKLEKESLKIKHDAERKRIEE